MNSHKCPALWEDQLNARLAEPARQRVQDDQRRIVIIGARGWIGRVTVTLLRKALGSEGFARRVVCFGSDQGEVVLDDAFAVPQQALAALPSLAAEPSIVLHLAFLTKDKVAGMDADDYAARNRVLSAQVFGALERIGADRLFVASSGAAAAADDPAAAADLRLYGALKREDEEAAAAWAQGAPGRRAAIGRIFSVSGPYMNKPETYALASFILDALAGRAIEVRAPMQVMRSYVAVREVISLVFAALLDSRGKAVLRFETGGEPMELAEVAGTVAKVLGGTVERRPITSPAANCYFGDAGQWLSLLASHGMSHLPIDRQISETSSYFSRTAQAFAGSVVAK